MTVPEIKPKGFASDTYGENRTILGLTPKEDAFAATFVLIVIGIIAIGLCLYMATRPARIPQPCDDPASFQCLDSRVQQCLTSEQYTKDQCVMLVGGNK